MTNQQILSDFNPEKIKEKAESDIEDKKIMDFLSKKTTKELADEIITNCHPKPAWKESEEETTWRYYYLKEFSRRGLQVYKDLDWPANKDSLYVNLNIGEIANLYDVVTSGGIFTDRHTIANQSWSVVENWEPYDSTKPNEYLLKYLKEEIERCNKELSKDLSQTMKAITKASLFDAQKKLIKEENRIK